MCLIKIRRERDNHNVNSGLYGPVRTIIQRSLKFGDIRTELQAHVDCGTNFIRKCL